MFVFVFVAVALFCPEFRLDWVGEKALPFVLTREPGRLAARSIISAFLEDRGGGKAYLFGGCWSDGRGTGSGRV